MKTINVENPNSLPTIAFSALKERFELNALKEAKNRDVGSLKRLIIEEGFIVPIVIWKEGSYIVDGSGRVIALGLLEYEGYEIPEIPYMVISAKNRKQAKKRALAISSRYGVITDDSLKSFVLGDGDAEEVITDIGLFELGLDLDTIDLQIKSIKDKPKKERGTAKSKLVHKCPNCQYEFSSGEEK